MSTCGGQALGSKGRRHHQHETQGQGMTRAVQGQRVWVWVLGGGGVVLQWNDQGAHRQKAEGSGNPSY